MSTSERKQSGSNIIGWRGKAKRSNGRLGFISENIIEEVGA
ncbi:MAG: hypothetical protein SPI30_10325 [Prevotella sp.]|nr:hypothetical protein [Prevotella sp.]